MREMLSDMLFMYGLVAVSVGVAVSFISVVLVNREFVSSDEVVVKVVFEKARSRYSFLLEKLFVLSHTSWACLVRVLIVVALCDIGS